MSSKDEKDKSHTDTTSAPDAIPRWSLEEWYNEGGGKAPLETTTVKCSECKIPTLHEWFKFGPTPLFETNDMIEIVSKARRTTCCTACGLVKTIT